MVRKPPSLYIKRRVVSLVYWENPYCSGGVLAGLLGVLILTQYYSVLQMAAAFFTLVTGVNLIYVNAHKQGQRVFNGKPVDEVTNPHSQRFKATYIPRDRVVRTAQLAVDVVEAVVQQVIRLVLIEDSWRSAWAVAVAYLVWTLATYVSTKYLAVAFLLGAFSVPRIYSQNQELIDNQVAQCSAQGRAIVERYGSVASKKAKDLYGQAVNAVSKKKTA
ncbi:Reticulon-domain-containing protein [Dichotomocladium elegans]|nr:Reticulon-domain-containing protein [Dichotomocladium elegans]